MSCQPEITPIAEFNFRLPIGSFYKIDNTWSAIDDPTTLTDFTGADSEVEIREGGPTGEILLTLSIDDGTIVIDGTTLTWLFNAADTDEFSATQKYYFWRVTMPEQQQQTLLKGKITPELS